MGRLWESGEACGLRAVIRYATISVCRRAVPFLALHAPRSCVCVCARARVTEGKRSAKKHAKPVQGVFLFHVLAMRIFFVVVNLMAVKGRLELTA
jgi:hypothetical protein